MTRVRFPSWFADPLACCEPIQRIGETVFEISFPLSTYFLFSFRKKIPNSLYILYVCSFFSYFQQTSFITKQINQKSNTSLLFLYKFAKVKATMMMSIFSSFDALSAEFFGQKLSLAKPSTTETKQQEVAVGPFVSDTKTTAAPPSNPSARVVKKAGEASPPSSSRQQLQKRQRFALELDGVHCFETIVPY